MPLLHLQEGRPWYREPWVWLLILFPATAVVGGLITIYIAVTTSDGLVVDDYYKRGKAINRDLARDYAAAGHQLTAHLDIDLSRNQVVLGLQARDYALPDAIRLSFLHPTRKGQDQQTTLQRGDDGSYTGPVDELARGNWYLQLEADDWRLSGVVQLPQTTPLVLLPTYAAQP